VSELSDILEQYQRVAAKSPEEIVELLTELVCDKVYSSQYYAIIKHLETELVKLGKLEGCPFCGSTASLQVKASVRGVWCAMNIGGDFEEQVLTLGDPVLDDDTLEEASTFVDRDSVVDAVCHDCGSEFYYSPAKGFLKNLDG